MNIENNSKKYKFKSLSSHYIQNRGRSYTVINPVACDDFSWLRGKSVEIDGVVQIVKGVESHAITHIKKGALIGLLVE